MKEQLNDEEYNLFEELYNKEFKYVNNVDLDFQSGKGCLDYIWVEYKGKNIMDSYKNIKSR